MNIFELYLDKIKSVVVDLNKNNQLEIPESFNGINAEMPPPKFDCDISTNVAMVLSKINKTSPLQLAEKLAPEIKNNDSEIETISVAKPGFINIKFKPSYWSNFIKNITDNADSFGINDKEKKNNYLVEFVSANPTGPLHVGHCRGAILGDVISNVLIFNKHKVTKEYYVNDYGNQIINFTKSVYFRIREVHFKETFPEDNPDLYPGDYLIDFAKNIISNNSGLNFDNFDEINDKLTALSIEQALLLIKNNLNSLGINHDNFVSEKSIVLNNEVESVIDFLEKNNFIYKGKIKAPAGDDNKNWVEREQLLFKSTDFGDDKDRALQKSDGTWTYFASDVAYHKNKVDRKFDYLINILGADHAGYIKRITSSVEALSGKKDKLTVLSIEQALLLIKNNLKSLGIKHDNFVSEKNIVLNNEVESVIDFLEKNNFIYKGKIKAPAGEDNKDWVEREQLLFKSTEFGDDKDRALQKSDGTWTYFASDVAYHKNKVDRNFDYLINILGADHAGYIKRITSSVEALSGKKDTLICKISQLVKLIKDNKPFKMSKRKGDYITVDDLIEEVGRDATRFIMLNRSSDVELDFDFDAVKEKSKDNPLYYVQYCYARISSVFRHIDKDLNSKIQLNDFNFEYSNDEIKILKKLSEWPKCIDAASTKLEPHRIPVYLYDLASEFHSYWNLGKQFPEKRFINDQKTVSPDKLIFLKAISNVIKTGMDIVGVDTPNQM